MPGTGSTGRGTWALEGEELTGGISGAITRMEPLRVPDCSGWPVRSFRVRVAASDAAQAGPQREWFGPCCSPVCGPAKGWETGQYR